MGLGECGVEFGDGLRFDAEAWGRGMVPSVAPSRSRSEPNSPRSAETRPVSGPSFAGNGAHLQNDDVGTTLRGEARRETIDRPARTARWRIMDAMPEQSSAFAASAFTGRVALRIGGRPGL